MKIRLPKVAYCSGGKSKTHLPSNLDDQKTVCGQSYGMKIEKLWPPVSISKMEPEKRCLKCFEAFILEED